MKKFWIALTALVAGVVGAAAYAVYREYRRDFDEEFDAEHEDLIDEGDGEDSVSDEEDEW